MWIVTSIEFDICKETYFILRKDAIDYAALLSQFSNVISTGVCTEDGLAVLQGLTLEAIYEYEIAQEEERDRAFVNTSLFMEV